MGYLYHIDDVLYALFNEYGETFEHLFFTCNLTYSVWQLLYNWLNITTLLPSQPINHFTTHMGMISNNRLSKFWSIILLVTPWAIWLSKNDFIFNSIKHSLHKTFYSAKVKSWL
ncbi:hypothetical protein Lalb_Chr11g0067301 [Lupinus albus]|uniref:Reverse transcriptase zinc-binding domain-containing protein n=1 Tax=Lupinus albus TaxID=3870 RepID=A0A6A4PRY9_LUPAL|nr:hypothetical protein Lalb_Chr11g0067301 [Lupinus albus]